MPDFKLSDLLFHSKGKASSRGDVRRAPATLSITMESPPPVYYGQPSSSTGALVSGQLKLNINEEAFDIVNYDMNLTLEATRKKPYHSHCTDCQLDSEVLKKWKFLQSPTKLKNGEHSYPFSVLLPGDLPASMDGPLSKIEYKFHAVVESSEGRKVRLDQILEVKRAIFPNALPKHSIRVFPPTELIANVDLPSVIYPIGESTATMRVEGIVRRDPDQPGVQRQWCLLRMIWRLEETHKVLSPACAKHGASKSGPPNAGEESPKPKAHENIAMRVIGNGELCSGWKSDYTTPTGSIELEFPFSITSPKISRSCDIQTSVVDISHQLMVEMIVVEEQSQDRRTQQGTPTGAARVLRMHFNLVVTERSGLGISWDEEIPPVYEDVPSCPPGYMYDLVGEELSDVCLPHYAPPPN